jgi:hypothetical protein
VEKGVKRSARFLAGAFLNRFFQENFAGLAGAAVELREKKEQGEISMPFGKRLSWLAAVIAAACALALVFGPLQAARAAGAFSDTGGHWAEQSILKMNAFGIVQGFPDGTFRPKESIEFQQALVMIMNALGWAEEAGKTDPAGLVIPVETWAKGYLALAVKKGMLNKDALPSLNPRRPATRLEVASLLCLALKLEPDQSALTFSDTDKINVSYRGYVGAIVKKGIMIGLPGNLFAPEGEITRAQMCVLLSRAIDKNLVDPPPPNKRLVGRITGVDRENGTLTVRSLGGEETFSYATGCPLYDGGRKVTAGALAENRRIELIVASDGKKVLYGGLLGDPGPVQSEEEGFVKSFAPGRGGYTLVLEPEEKAELSLGVYEDARLFKGGRELTAGEIKPDRYLRALLDGNGKVLEMELYDPVTVSGTLLALDRDTLTVKSQGTEREYGISKNVRVTRNGIRPVSLAELKTGDYVSILTLKDRVFAVDCLSDTVSVLSGMVSKLRGDYLYVYVQNEEKRYALDPGAAVFKNGEKKDLSVLKRGDYVSFEVADGERVISVELIDEQEGEFTGTVLYLGTGSRPYVTFRISGGLELDYEIIPGVSVYRYGDRINLEEVVPGARVRVKVDEGRVSEIEVLDDRNITIRGVVVNINEEKGRVTLEVNGRNYSYDLAPDLTVLNAEGKTVKLTDVLNFRADVLLKEGAVKEIRLAQD